MIVQHQVSATELNKTSGKVLDLAMKGAVRVVRSNNNFIIIQEDYLNSMLESANKNYPKTIQDMLVNYDQDKIRSLVRNFL